METTRGSTVNTVKEMLDIKGHEVWTIDADQSIYEAVKMMEEQHVGTLPVLDGEAHLIGIVSERDCARNMIMTEQYSKDSPIREVMTRKVITVREEVTIDECRLIMIQNKIRHLPVVDGDKIIGLIAVVDLLTFTIDEQSTTIEELKDYIMEERGGSG